MSAISACVSSRFTLPGLPITSERGGTFCPSTSSVPAATIEPVPTCAPFRTIAPIPIRHWSSMVQPWMHRGVPDRHVIADAGRMRAGHARGRWHRPGCSVRWPTLIQCTSPRMTAHIQTPALLTDFHVADDLRADVDECGGMDARRTFRGRDEALSAL